MGCGNEISKWDDNAVQDSLAGKNTGIETVPKEILVEVMPAVEAAKEDFHRAIEETGRQELAEERAVKDEANPEYQAKLQTIVKLEVEGGEHQVLIRGFDASRINNEDVARAQVLFPAIITQTTKEITYTGKIPGSEMDARGKIWAGVEKWDVKEGKGMFEVNRHTPEQVLGVIKSEDELTSRQRDKLTQAQMDSQLHANFHTIYEILFTDEDRVEGVERICYEATEKDPNWAQKVSEYAGQKAEEGRNDEVFCEFGMRLMTDIRTSPDKPSKLEELNPELYSFIKDRLERLSRLSDTLGLKLDIRQ